MVPLARSHYLHTSFSSCYRLMLLECKIFRMDVKRCQRVFPKKIPDTERLKSVGWITVFLFQKWKKKTWRLMKTSPAVDSLTPPDSGNTHLLLQAGWNKFFDFICKCQSYCRWYLLFLQTFSYSLVSDSLFPLLVLSAPYAFQCTNNRPVWVSGPRSP